MKPIIQFLLFLFLQFNLFGSVSIVKPIIKHQLHISVKNLDGETVKTAKVTVTQLESGLKQTVNYQEEKRCFIAINLETGKVLIKVENKGYDTQEYSFVLRGPYESPLITLGKTHSKYRILNSNKYPLETDGKTVAFFAGKDTTYTQIFKNPMRGTAVLKSGWYKYESITTLAGTVYLITPSKKQQQRYLIADLRKLYPNYRIGPLVSMEGEMQPFY